MRHDNETDNYLFVSLSSKWHIARKEQFESDSSTAYAYADSNDEYGNARCPQDIDYIYCWLNALESRSVTIAITSSQQVTYFKGEAINRHEDTHTR